MKGTFLKIQESQPDHIYIKDTNDASGVSSFLTFFSLSFLKMFWQFQTASFLLLKVKKNNFLLH